MAYEMHGGPMDGALWEPPPSAMVGETVEMFTFDGAERVTHRYRVETLGWRLNYEGEVKREPWPGHGATEAQ